jgi:hypothetical protein
MAIHGGAVRGSRTDPTGFMAVQCPILFILSILSKKPLNAWRCAARFANRSYGIMVVQCLILLILSILSKKPLNAWRCAARFTNRGYGEVDMQCAVH